MIASIAKVKVITNIAVHSPTYDNSLAVITGIFHVHHFMVILMSFRLNSTCKERFPCKSFWQRTFPNFKFTFLLGKEQLNISKQSRRKMFDLILCIIYKILFWFQIQGFGGVLASNPGFGGVLNGSYQGNKFYTDPCHCTAGSGSDATARFHRSHHRICPRSAGHSNEPQTCASAAINQHNYLNIIFWLWESFRQEAECYPCQKWMGIF